jgi:hypothetical protein
MFLFFNFAAGAIRNIHVWCDRTLNMHLHICILWLALLPRLEEEETCVCVRVEEGRYCTVHSGQDVHFSVVKTWRGYVAHKFWNAS